MKMMMSMVLKLGRPVLLLHIMIRVYNNKLSRVEFTALMNECI